MKTKEALLNFCWDHFNDRMENLKKSRASLQESLNSETKSSAGDKYETGRAMVQLELEKLGKQFSELEKLKEVLQKVDIEKRSRKVGLGSLVETTNAHYFIAISAGAFNIDDIAAFCISANAPIAKLLLGKENGDTFVFNGKEHAVAKVL